MKRVIATALFVFLPVQGFAKNKDGEENYRWAGSNPRVNLLLSTEEVEPSLPPSEVLLKGVGEFVARESQMVGAARVAGSWKQTVMRPDGTVAYAAGSVKKIAPAEAAALHAAEEKLSAGLAEGLRKVTALQTAAKVFPPRLEVKKSEEGQWRPYWRVEYLTPRADRLKFVALDEFGSVIDEGQLDWDGLDGRSYAFPDGEKLGGIQDVTLKDLSGDGTVTGKVLHVISELGLNVYSPDLNFFFPQTDRRFDLGQAYFVIDQGYRWLKDHLGVELDHPIEVRLHVGNGGVSNAAFYHGNTIYLGTGDGVIYQDMLRDPTILVHESIHAVIDAYVGLPPDGEGGGFNEGFADLFAGLILNTPRMGENSYVPAPHFKRTMENHFKAYQDFGPGVYQNGTIVAGTFWDMKEQLGTELTAKLAFRTLVRLGAGAKFDDFSSALKSAADGLLSQDQTTFVMNVAADRGWKVAP